MADYISDGKTCLLSYFINTNDNVKSKQMHFCGFHKGQITGNNVIIENFTEISRVIPRTEELKLILTKEIVDDITNRAKKVGITLDEKIILTEKVSQVEKLELILTKEKELVNKTTLIEKTISEK